MNGKQFEKLIQDSCAYHHIDCVRLKDAGWMGEKTERRFTIRNICDFIVFNGFKLYKIEAKKRETSCRFDDLTQLKALTKEFKKVEPYRIAGLISELFVVYFQNHKRVFAIQATIIDELKHQTGKKSFNLKDLEALQNEHPLFCYEIRLEVPAGKRKALLRMDALN